MRAVPLAAVVDVLAENEDGTVDGLSRTYDDTPTADVPVWYSIRHPVASGQWSDWAGPVATEAPPPPPSALFWTGTRLDIDPFRWCRPAVPLFKVWAAA